MTTGSQHTILLTLSALSLLAAGCAAAPDSSPNESGGQIPGGGTPPPLPGTGGMPAAGGQGGTTSSTPTASGGAGGSVTPPDAVGTGGMGGAGVAGGTAGAAGMTEAGAGGAGGAPASAVGLLPRVTTTDGPGPFDKVVKVMNTPPGGWMIYPEDIGRDGIKHPLFVFGPGGGTTPQTYESMGMHWDRYGSYGFVIYVLPASTGDGADMKAGLDWLIAQNDDMASPLYQHLDTTRICAAGHSQGSVTTFDFMPDERVTTTIHISGGSLDGMGSSHLSMAKDTMFLCGEMNDPATPQCDHDFMTSTIPTFYTVIAGSSHLTSGRLGWEAIIAWLLWHLADQEDQWKKEFVEPTGKFHMGVYQSQVKNW